MNKENVRFAKYKDACSRKHLELSEKLEKVQRQLEDSGCEELKCLVEAGKQFGGKNSGMVCLLYELAHGSQFNFQLNFPYCN